ncbi:MAG: hypothetical protein IPL40_08745 [Proteobacteria bacterium]|nr:hypothetical protein [Pseudomonadota bacterium]
MAANQAGQLSVRGIVVTVRLDDEGEALAVAVATAEGEQYLIDSGEKGDELLNFVEAFVEVVGLARLADGELHLSVSDYQLVEAAPGEDEEGDEGLP